MKTLFLVAGASKGLGKEVSIQLKSKDSEVIIAARGLDKLNDLAQRHDLLPLSFDGTDFDSTLFLAKSVLERYRKKDFERLVVVFAADMHEPASIIDRGVKRFTVEADFSEKYINKARRLSVESPVKLFDHLNESDVNLSFVYISSNAANAKFWNKGNSVYGKNKRAAELEFDSKEGAYCLRFGFIYTDMSTKLLKELEGLDSGVHVDNNISNPLVKAEDVFLEAREVAKDIKSFIHGERDNFCIVSGNIFEYIG